MSAGFEVNLATAEELPLLAIKLNIPEPINPANIIVSVIAVPPTFIPIRLIQASTAFNPLISHIDFQMVIKDGCHCYCDN
jgi:hypothetical protein